MCQESIIGIDLGGSKLNIGVVKDKRIVRREAHPFAAGNSEEQTLEFIISCIQRHIDTSITGIGIGVPSVVDISKGIVYNAVNIPSWKKVYLKESLESAFRIPVMVNNDANCFTIGEKYFGKAKGYSDVVGICLGTGFGAGVVLNNRLHTGRNCGVGEIGSVLYRESNIEAYCSGRFFSSIYSISGLDACAKAASGDIDAINIFREFGLHLGNAISTILLAFDPEIIVLGGSISKAYQFFIDSVWESLSAFPYSNITDCLVIEKSTVDDISILGAAALFFGVAD